MNKIVRKYFSRIGRKGGRKSRRIITPEQQAKMQAGRRKIRENNNP
jgi:hypothetical protein